MASTLKSLGRLNRSYVWILAGLFISVFPLFLQEDEAVSSPLFELPLADLVFKKGDDKAWAQPGFDTSDWQPVGMPHNWWQSGYKRMGAKGWYRLSFSVDPAYQAQALVLSLGYIGTLSEIYLNGQRIGGEGSFYPVSLPPQRTLHAAVLPAGLLNYGEGKKNTLAIRVKSLVGAGGLLSDAISIYPGSSFWEVKEQVEYSREMWKIAVFAICLVAFCLFTIMSFLVQASYRLTYRASAWIAYACGFGVFYNTHILQDINGLSPVVGLAYFLMTVIMPLAVYFLSLSVSGVKKCLPFTTIASVAVLAYVFVALTNPEHFHRAAIAYAFLWMFIIVLVTGLLVRGMYVKEPNALAVFFGLLIFSGFSCLELFSLGYGWLTYATLFWGPVEVGVLGFLITMAFVLLRQYTRLYYRERALSHRLLKVQDDERRRIGHNLHDSVAQDLIGLQYELKLLQKKMNPQEREQVASLSGHTKEILTEVRTLAEDFQPMGKRDTTLAEAIAAWQVHLQKRFACSFESNIEPIDLDATHSEAIYRIIQEATQNACRHGRAKLIKITLSTENEHALKLSIEDNGRGFDSANMNEKRLGLTFMKDRAEALGGSLSLKSGVGQGVSIIVLLPREKTQEAID